MKRALAFALLLASCASKPPDVPAPPVIEKQIVKVPVQVHCKPAIGAAPAFADGDAKLYTVPYPRALANLRAKPSDTGALQQELSNLAYQMPLLIIGRLQRIQWEKEQAAALVACQ